MNLHDWIDELSDLLEVETEADEGLLSDLSRVARENVDSAAGPVTAFLLGVAAGARDAGPDVVERLAAEVQELAEAWDRPAGLDTDVDEEADHEVDDDLADIDRLDFTAEAAEDEDELEEAEDAEGAQEAEENAVV